jgi:uncharacterized membrane protein YedE/YeeE
LKIISRILLLIAVAAIVYGYWGAFTSSGNKVYDEMDAFYPFFILIAGIILLIVFFVLLFITKKRAKKITKTPMLK